MGRWLERVRTASRPPLWLDDTAYASALLAQGKPPWRDAAAVVAWRRKAMQLLKPDVAVIDVAALGRAWPHRADLLQEPAFRDHLGEITRALRASTDKPLALSLPAPAAWRAQVAESIQCEWELDVEAIDDLAGDMAGLLRSQSESGIDAVLLREAAISAEQCALHLDLYSSLTNTAHHYRWDIGLHAPGGVPADLAAFDFAIAPAGALGVELGPQFWAGDAAQPAIGGAFHFATVPADAQPSQVLARLESRS
ncbi:MAG TPA: hypothetical protein VMT29_10805 [Steroidobacteraceae bacterium]|nr:hypothetical protein [Steroidobacteraceae bacterium]